MILITFVTNVTDKVGNQKVLYFPRHLASASVLTGQTGNPEIVFSLKCCMLFTKNTWNTMKNITRVTAEPPVTVKTIDCVHQTEPRNGA